MEIEKEEKNIHTQSGERRKMSERFKNSSVLEKMGNNSTKETKAKVTF